MRPKHLLLLLWIILVPTTILAQERQKWVEWGIKAGVNAPYIAIEEFEINGIKKDDPETQTQVGYFFALFSRVNLHKHYIQLEASTHYTRSEIAVDLTDFGYSLENTGIDPTSKIKFHRRTLEVPLLYGYNFVKKNPYELALFVGPKLRYSFDRGNDDTQSSNNAIEIHEEVQPLTACIVFGLGTRISNFVLDVRYEFGVNNISKSSVYTLKLPTGENSGELTLNRRMNLMSFSLGVTF